LLWALDGPPSHIPLCPAIVKDVFAPGLRLQDAQKSRRRVIRSHWYWLERTL
jgi:hypothetical protein